MAKKEQPSALPDEQTLSATAERLKNVLAGQSGGLESMRAMAAPEPQKSAKEQARERLRANPREAIARRLRRKGIAPTPLESSFESMISPEAVFPASAQLDDTDIARGLERIIGRNELLGVQYLDGGQVAARCVGRIVVRLGPSKTAPMGTGFLIAPGLLMTNNHVLPTLQSARGGVVQFNYQCGLDGNLLNPASFALDPDTFYLTSKAADFDFTLVAVRDSANGEAKLADFGFKRLAALSDEVLDGESVTIIQHPGGEPKQIALRENFVLALPDVADRYLYYQTDTTPGSSGSPVFNDDWEVVALHHSGYAKRNAKGEILARDGRVWTSSMGEDQIDWIANEGIRVAALVNHLGSVKGLDDGKKQILMAALAALPAADPPAPPKPATVAPVVENREAVASPPPPARPEPAPPSFPPVMSPGAVETTVNIPLHVTVRIGTLQTGSGTPASPVAAEGLEKVDIDTDYSDREGYNPAFLGGGNRRVPLPQMKPAMVRDAAVNFEPADGAPKFELPYHYYSVVLNARRRLAFFTAVNIDGTQEQNLGKRQQDKWIFDHRVESRLQIGNEWYAKPFDRGHLVRRLDPAWGRTRVIAKTANDDTFHFTNCSPQHARFNEGKNLWQGLENYLLDTATQEDRRLSVFTGPVFAADDPVYEGVQVPKQFWKVAVWVRPDGSMGAAGFLVSQEELLTAMGLEAAAEQVARTFQARISAIEKLTKLDFGRLRTVDTFQSGGAPLEALEASPIELEAFEQIQF